MQMTDISIKALTKPGRYTDDQTKGLLGIPDDRDRSFRRIVTEDSDLS
jgi:hypothetical protein